MPVEWALRCFVRFREVDRGAPVIDLGAQPPDRIWPRADRLLLVFQRPKVALRNILSHVANPVINQGRDAPHQVPNIDHAANRGSVSSTVGSMVRIGTNGAPDCWPGPRANQVGIALAALMVVIVRHGFLRAREARQQSSQNSVNGKWSSSP